jgi:hypothetical protein
VGAGVGAACSPGPRALMTAEADAMHGVLVQRADALEDCIEGSEEERELAASPTRLRPIYEGKRWPEGREPGGKGK